jgi:hypothetical protein
LHLATHQLLNSKETIMKSEKNLNAGDGMESAISGGAISRRWLLKNTANMAAGTLAIASLGSAKAESKPGAEVRQASTEHDPHTNRKPAFKPAEFEGWESV